MATWIFVSLLLLKAPPINHLGISIVVDNAEANKMIEHYNNQLWGREEAEADEHNKGCSGWPCRMYVSWPGRGIFSTDTPRPVR